MSYKSRKQADSLVLWGWKWGCSRVALFGYAITTEDVCTRWQRNYCVVQWGLNVAWPGHSYCARQRIQYNILCQLCNFSFKALFLCSYILYSVCFL